MTDILQDMADVVAQIDDGEADSDTLDISAIYILLSRAMGEIERLRKSNSDMGWQLNPDRMGGSFSDWETNRRGDEWS
jgi:hypothetical protein